MRDGRLDGIERQADAISDAPIGCDPSGLAQRHQRFELTRQRFDRVEPDDAGGALQAMNPAMRLLEIKAPTRSIPQHAANRIEMLALLDLKGRKKLFANLAHTDLSRWHLAASLRGVRLRET